MSLEQAELADKQIAAFKDAVIQALQGSPDFEDLAPNEHNFLQCIRRLRRKVNVLSDLLADKDPRIGRLDVLRMVEGFEDPLLDLEIRNNTLARRISDLEHENRALTRANRNLHKQLEGSG